MSVSFFWKETIDVWTHCIFLGQLRKHIMNLKFDTNVNLHKFYSQMTFYCLPKILRRCHLIDQCFLLASQSRENRARETTKWKLHRGINVNENLFRVFDILSEPQMFGNHYLHGSFSIDFWLQITRALVRSWNFLRSRSSFFNLTSARSRSL